MKRPDEKMKELQAILISAILTILIVAFLFGCTPSALTGIENIFRTHAEFCRIVADGLQDYRECMANESSPN